MHYTGYLDFWFTDRPLLERVEPFAALGIRHFNVFFWRQVSVKDENGIQLWTIYKERSDSPHKIDAAMAAILAWEARSDALAAGEAEQRRSVYEDRGLMVV